MLSPMQLRDPPLEPETGVGGPQPTVDIRLRDLLQAARWKTSAWPVRHLTVDRREEYRDRAAGGLGVLQGNNHRQRGASAMTSRARQASKAATRLRVLAALGAASGLGVALLATPSTGVGATGAAIRTCSTSDLRVDKIGESDFTESPRLDLRTAQRRQGYLQAAGLPLGPPARCQRPEPAHHGRPLRRLAEDGHADPLEARLLRHHLRRQRPVPPPPPGVRLRHGVHPAWCQSALGVLRRPVRPMRARPSAREHRRHQRYESLLNCPPLR